MTPAYTELTAHLSPKDFSILARSLAKRLAEGKLTYQQVNDGWGEKMYYAATRIYVTDYKQFRCEAMPCGGYKVFAG